MYAAFPVLLVCYHSQRPVLLSIYLIILLSIIFYLDTIFLLFFFILRNCLFSILIPYQNQFEA